MTRWRTVLAYAAWCLAAVSGAACGAANTGDREIVVAAASDLAAAMPALAAAFEGETGVRVTASLGASGQLAQQVLNGAPIDVFMSADRAFIDMLAGAGRVAQDGRAVYAHGEIALVTGSARAARLERLEQLADADVARVAIANPDHAPYGRAAREALHAAGVWDALADRVVIAENVRQTLQFTGTGNVDAAISAVPLMSDGMRWVAVPSQLHAPLVQEAAVVAGRTTHAEAAAFLRFLTSPRGREILLRYHFALPDTAA